VVVTPCNMGGKCCTSHVSSPFAPFLETRTRGMGGGRRALINICGQSGRHTSAEPGAFYLPPPIPLPHLLPPVLLQCERLF
jgi:hypothetical protein